MTIGGTIGPVTYDEDFLLMPLFGENGDGVMNMIRMLNTKSPHWGV